MTLSFGDEFIKNTAFLERGQTFRMLEIGSYHGLTSNFIADQLLAWNGQLICVDPLESSYQLDPSEGNLFEGQYEKFIENTARNKDRITLIRKTSQEVLPNLRDNFFDFIYVDGDHTYNNCYFDGTEAFRLCKVGGYILFDDYNGGNNGEMQQAIDRVLAENPHHAHLLKHNQVLVRKSEPNTPTMNAEDRYQEITVEKLFNEETIYAAYCNLDERSDRNEKMIKELNRVGFKAERQRSWPWKELYDNFTDEEKQKVDVMHSRQKTPGAIGCWYSQVEIMNKALEAGKHAMVFEDDLVFCDDFNERLKIIYKFLNQHEWDIFWLGGTYHLEPTWHKSVEGKHTHASLKMCKCILNRDWEPTFHPNIVRTYGAFSTHAYLVNKDRIGHILGLLDRNMHRAMGIDWVMILEQPNLFTYAFNPGCVKQFDSQSNIGDGVSKFSGFRKLGNHWWSRKMNEYIPD